MAGAKLPLTDRGKSQIKAVGATGDFGGYWSGRNWTDGWTAKGSSCEGDLVVDGQDRGGQKIRRGLPCGVLPVDCESILTDLAVSKEGTGLGLPRM